MNAPGWLTSLDSMGFIVLSNLISVFWQSSILLGAVGILNFLLRRREESVRHALWMTAVFAIPLLPLLAWGISSVGTPQQELYIIPSYSPPHAGIVETPLNPQIHQYDKSRSDRRAFMPLPHSTQPDAPPVTLKQYGEMKYSSVTDYPWALAFMGYIVAAMIFLMWIIIGRLRIRSWILNGRAVIDTGVIEVFQSVKEQLKLSKEFIIIENGHVPAPMTCRIFHPVVMLPPGFTENLSDSELSAVAVHELTHVKRHDILTLTAVSIIRAVLFFHPLVWLAAREISFLAENVCDNAVLKLTAGPVSYAQFLTRIAKNMPERALSTELVTGLIFSKSAFLRRVEAILSENREKIRKLSRWLLAGTVAAAVMSLVVALAFPLGERKDSGGNIITVSGKVLHNRNPVPNADVYLHIPRNPSPFFDIHAKAVLTTKTEKDGSFSFEFDSYLLNRKYLLPKIVIYSPRLAVGLINISNDTDFANIPVYLADAATVTGIVKDSMGNPVRDANVIIRLLRTGDIGWGNFIGAIPGLMKKTDGNGAFVLTNLPEGANLALELNGAGYAKAMYPGETSRYIFAGSKNITITLEHEGIIEGRITHRNTGKPAKDIRVYAESLDTKTFSSDIVTTDKNGNYTITKLAAGLYYIILVQEREFPEWTAGVIENVSVKSGKTVKNINLQLIKGGIITGKATDSKTGEPLQGIHVKAIPPEWEPRIVLDRALTGKNGMYRLRTAPGRVRICFYTPAGYVYSSRTEANVDVVDGETLNDVDFKFTKGIDITGKVLSPEGTPVAGALVSGKYFGDWRGSVISDDDGKFTIKGMSKKSKLYIETEHKNKKLKAENHFELEQVKEMEIQLEHYETGGVEGRVIDEQGNPLQGANIKLSKSIKNPFSMIWSVPRSIVAVTDDSGYFSLTGLIIGENEGSLSAETEGYKYASIISMKDLRPGVQHLEDTVMEIDTADRWIEGTVTDSDGKPVVGARLSINIGYYNIIQVYSDTRGYYRMDNLKYVLEQRIQLRHKDYGYYRFENIPTNETHNFKLVKAEYYLSGKVVDPDNNPLEGARVSIEPWEHESGFTNASILTSRNGEFRFDHILDEEVDISFYHHEKGLSKQFEKVTTNRDGVTFVLEEINRSKRPERPVWEFDKKRIVILEGKPAPELQVSRWVQGEPVRLENLNGKIVILDFWTGSYRKSVDGLRIMRTLKKEYGDHGVVIIGIHEHTEDIEAVKELIKEYNISYRIAVDGKSPEEDSMGITFDSYGLSRTRFPNMIIDKGGKIYPDIYDADLPGKINMLVKKEK